MLRGAVNHKDFLIIHINMRSLLKNFEKLEEMINDLHVSPDIIAISETKLKNNVPFNSFLTAYDFMHQNSKTNAGGVALFVKSIYLFNVVDSFNLNAEKCEDTWIEQCSTKNKSCVIG